VLVDVRELSVALPGGHELLSNVTLSIAAGQVVALLGPSGAGKSTLLRAVFQPEALRERGYLVSFSERHVASPPAMVPQRGALFDHLDVRGNIQLARDANDGDSPAPEEWLEAVELDLAMAEPGRKVSALSGGQAQRVAVARTLAAGKRVLILDEPSVGLDPLGVRRLARLLVDRARASELAIVVITHDLTLAAGCADVVLFLDPERRTVRPLAEPWGGPAELADAEDREQRVLSLDREVAGALEDARKASTGQGGTAKRRRRDGPTAVRVAGSAVVRALDPRLFVPSARVMLRAARQSLVLPLPFYAVVGTLLGFTVLYVIAKMSADVRVGAMLKLVGGTYILSLAPPLSAILFAATSGNAVNAWLGGMQVGRQVEALEGLGIRPERYLWSPAWLALSASYLLTVAVFVSSMMLGGWLLFQSYGVPDALAILSSDFLDPAPEREPYLVRGLWLVVTYAIAIASIVVSRAAAAKDEAADVTSAMTSAVVRATLFVVAMELASVMVLFWAVGQ
jgi:ABC-type nitrate/sulfonate/bicarbonate transport system ATPase subunit/ABC-type transporter Mla maintaining outer membrane lipid asymmetry permease subunit MlaE